MQFEVLSDYSLKFHDPLGGSDPWVAHHCSNEYYMILFTNKFRKIGLIGN